MTYDFFCYSLLKNKPVGSESPRNHANPSKLVPSLEDRYGIDSVVVLEERCNGSTYRGLDVFHCPLSSNRPPSVFEIQPIVSEILELIQKDKKVWIHCSKGIDRTGCVCGSVLGFEYGDADKAIDEMNGYFPESRQNKMMRDLWEPYAKVIREEVTQFDSCHEL